VCGSLLVPRQNVAHSFVLEELVEHVHYRTAGVSEHDIRTLGLEALDYCPCSIHLHLFPNSLISCFFSKSRKSGLESAGKAKGAFAGF
jgi:hypothetical protein